MGKRERRDRYKREVTRHTSKRFKTDENQDPEIEAELDKGNIVTIIEDSYNDLINLESVYKQVQ